MTFGLPYISKYDCVIFRTRICIWKMILTVLTYLLYQINKIKHKCVNFFLVLLFFIYLFNWRLITILWWFLPYTDMNQPWVYMCFPSWTPLPPPSASHPSGSSQRTIPEHPVSCIEPELVIYFTYDNIHASMLFSQIIPPSPSPTESKSLFFTSVSLLLFRISGHHYHLSKFHIYALIYCIGVFLSDLLRSV